MRRLSVINGKRMRAPSYDDKTMSAPVIGGADDASTEFGSFLGLEREYPSTHDRDRDLLIALGVDGTVPLAQARRNAATANYYGGITPNDAVAYMRSLRPANDNHELAAQAA